jgi:hypothetical protein
VTDDGVDQVLITMPAAVSFRSLTSIDPKLTVDSRPAG